MRLFNILTVSIVCATCLSFSKTENRSLKKDQTLIIFFNSEANYPSQITIIQFWGEKDVLDTLVVLSNRLNMLLDRKLSQSLEDTIINTGGFDEFHYAVAFIRERKGEKDTIYASPLLKYWKKGEKDYVDRTGFFEKAFGIFLLR